MMYTKHEMRTQRDLMSWSMLLKTLMVLNKEENSEVWMETV